MPEFFVTILLWMRHRCLVSQRAEVELSRNLSIGQGSALSSFTKIKTSDGPVRIGARTSIGTGCFIAGHGAGLSIGDDCLIEHARDRGQLPL